MSDVLVAGAGPAGCVAAIVLARAGARVTLIDRARFPRRKLCGDTVNPGAMALLRRLGLEAVAETGSRRVRGMVVSGGGVSITARYPAGYEGAAIERTVMDDRLVQIAAGLGVRIEEGVLATGTIRERGSTGDRVLGLCVRRGSRRESLRAPICVAADGRHSRLAFELGLSKHPRAPRRWAVGAYYAAVEGASDCGEMHIRRGYYLGVAGLPGDIVNACLVTGDRRRLADPGRALGEAIAVDPWLRDRFAHAGRVGPPVTMGPLAVDARSVGMPGLLLAGDAAGFVDPMTGDGLRFAFRSGELAGRAALLGLERGQASAQAALARWHREFGRKRAFNRALRRLVDSPRGIDLAAAGATPAARSASAMYRSPRARTTSPDRPHGGGRAASRQGMSRHERIAVTLAIVALLMLAEAVYSARNERRLRAAGAVEPAGDVYRLMRALYPLSFLIPAAEGWLTSSGGASLWPAGAVLFAAGKSLKYWAIATLGGLWSFRVLVLRGHPMKSHGPYRFMRHPNYVGVAGEIAGAALLCGGPWTGALFTLAFAALMRRRIALEERALAACSS